MSLNVPITYDTTDPNVWAGALQDALPMMFPATAQDLSGWFATTIEVGRRDETLPDWTIQLPVDGVDPMVWGWALVDAWLVVAQDLVAWFAAAIEAGRRDKKKGQWW